MPIPPAVRTLLATAALVAGRAEPARAAEVQLPTRSPPASVAQQVGITTIRIDYARAALGDRALAAVLPAGQLCVLAGSASVARLGFSRDVDFLGTPVAAGSYALLAIPGAPHWTIILNRDIDLGSAARYRPELDVARGQVRPASGPRLDRLQLAVADFSNDGAVVELAWGELRVPITIRVHTAEQVAAAIAALDDGWRWYADAAEYLWNVRHDPEAGLRYADRSVALQPNARNRLIRASLLVARRPGQRDARDHQPVPAAPLSMASADAESRAFHGGIAPVASAGSVEGERAAPRPATAAKPPSSAAIGAVVQRGRAELQACYQRALRQDPSLTSAHVKIRIDVGAAGSVKRIALDPGHPPAALEACIRSTVAGWAFPLSNVDYQAELPLAVQGVR